MARVKFDKNSEEWSMFNSYWVLVQKYYMPETEDEYYQNLLRDTDEFFKKYEKINLAKELVLAFINDIEKRAKQINK